MRVDHELSPPPASKDSPARNTPLSDTDWADHLRLNIAGENNAGSQLHSPRGEVREGRDRPAEDANLDYRLGFRVA